MGFDSVSQVPEVWHREGMFMGMHWLWWLFWIAALAVVLWAFARLFLDRRQDRSREAQRRRAEEALRERFARGEIDQTELLERLDTLRSTGLAGDGA